MTIIITFFVQLHAANRSWSVQYKLMKDQYMKQIDSLKEEIKVLKREKEEKDRRKTEEKPCKNLLAKPSDSSQNQLDLLTHQVCLEQVVRDLNC